MLGVTEEKAVEKQSNVMLLKENAKATYRLFVFPFAGGNMSNF